ncbi:peptidoglycan-binding domain-containing protein [Fulvimarina sp. 2208YS6-2-32]|uniref:Peptidoglycan-binding domain-containing protein n=1 Tax=Fulvimarina uroteuthidis TaxID=3098149 RepID=A0ABU5HYQ2_9HYPH|nr:peptidoglycan-binding domain-containing protein [Fulvimarina sp. 2208YS6-2-32]MDY8107724.1 peptidoglycan-binding domain-containing protein [Fulvimarina sp. 2208YS6-2-32]
MQRSAGRLEIPRRVCVNAGLAAGSLLKRGAGQLRRNPAISLGTAAFGAFFVWVAGNALFAQHEAHPAPLVMTRGTIDPSLDVAATGSTFDPLLQSLQSGLARTGHYRKTIDGRFGPGTRAAIERFQRENGLTVDGRPTPELLTRVRQVADLGAPSPSRKPVEWTDTEERELSATAADGRGDRVLQTPDSLSSIIELSEVETLSQAELVRKIQTGLNAISTETIVSDGIAGQQTIMAIKEFEKVEGLDVTGRPDEALLKELIRVGAFAG